MSRALMSEDNSVVEGNDNSTMLDDNNEEEYIKKMHCPTASFYAIIMD